MELGGRVFKPAGRVSEPTARVPGPAEWDMEPAERALDSRAWSKLGGSQSRLGRLWSQLGGPWSHLERPAERPRGGGDGGARQNAAFLVHGGTLDHCPLQCRWSKSSSGLKIHVVIARFFLLADVLLRGSSLHLS